MARILEQPTVFPCSGGRLSMRFTSRGAVVFPCVFSVSHLVHPFTHPNCFVSFTFFSLCSFWLSLYFFFLELLEEKNRMHLWPGVWAKLQVSCWWLSLLWKPSWHSFKNRSEDVIQRPLGHLSIASGGLYPLSSHFCVLTQQCPLQPHPFPHLAGWWSLFSSTKGGGISALLPAKAFHSPFPQRRILPHEDWFLSARLHVLLLLCAVTPSLRTSQQILFLRSRLGLNFTCSHHSIIA